MRATELRISEKVEVKEEKIPNINIFKSKFFKNPYLNKSKQNKL
tara:strand:+ start:928 stop:1059 length:132 start_codon:yes stop_codon:yes gene_type:complete